MQNQFHDQNRRGTEKPPERTLTEMQLTAHLYEPEPDMPSNSSELPGTAYLPAQSDKMKRAKKRALDKKEKKTSFLKQMMMVRSPKVRTIRVRSTGKFPTFIVLSAIFCTVLFMLILYNDVQLSQKQKEINALNAEKAAILENIDALELQLDQKNDLRVIQEQAIALGMVTRDQLVKQYIRIQGEEYIDAVEEEPETWDFVCTDLFNSVYQKLKSLVEYFR